MNSTTCFSLTDILQWSGGRVVNETVLVHPVSEIKIVGISGLKDSKPEDLAFFFSHHYQNEIPSMRAGVLITGRDFAGPLEKSGLPLWKNTAIVVCDDPYLAMAVLSKRIAEHQSTVAHVKIDCESRAEIHPSAVVHATAQLGRGVRIGANVVIEADVQIGEGSIFYPGCFVGPGCKIGKGSVLFPNVVLYEWTRLGDRVRLHSNVVIGADGFGYAPRLENGKIVEHEKIYHLGKVVIGDDVEIGAGTTIDRGTITDTLIDRGAKIDNNVQIGHNCHVGEGSIMCGNSGMAGSSTLGKFVYLGGFSGIGNQVVVGDGAKIAGATMIGRDVEPGESAMGYPHRDPRDFFKIHALLNQLLAKRKASRKES